MCERKDYCSVLKQALIESNRKQWESYEVTKIYERKLTIREKIKWNKWWRENIDIKKSLYPEVENELED